MTTTIVIIIVSIIFSAFFSGMEIAFIASNRLRIELDKKQKDISSRLIAIFTSNSSQYITTMLIGNNIALVVYGTYMAKLLAPEIEKYFQSPISLLLIQTIISTFFILITAEFLPKVIFRSNANFALDIFAVPVFMFYIFLYPLALFTNWLSKLLIRSTIKVNIPGKQTQTSFSKIDLDNFITESKEAISESNEFHHNIQIFQNALDFSKVKIRECIVPRNEIVAVEINQTIEELRALFIETGLSKILVYEKSIDNIIGYIHSSELFEKMSNIKSRLATLPIVPETMPANKLLKVFIQQRKNIALVVDEYGGTAGMVTMEDIVEEIFGEIEDEHDSTDFTEKQIREDEYIFSARLEIDYINEKYKLNLPVSEDYETLAGLIFDTHEDIPDVKQEIELENYLITVLEVSQTRIETINLKVIGTKENQ